MRCRRPTSGHGSRWRQRPVWVHTVGTCGPNRSRADPYNSQCRPREAYQVNDEIRKRLVELTDHLEVTDAPESQEIRGAVDEYHDDADHHALGERLHDWLLRLESSHPELSRLMARVLDAMPGV